MYLWLVRQHILILHYFIAGDDVLTRMKSLRTVYRKSLQKKGSGSAAEKMTTSERLVLEICAFLKPHLQNRESTSNLPKLYSKEKVNYVKNL
jgi:hypothetical protein